MRGCFHSFSATILHIFARIQRLCASLCFLSLLLSERWHTLSRIHCWDEHHRVDDKTQRRNHRRYLQNLKSLMRLLHRLCWSRFTIALPNLWSVLQVKVSLGKISDEVTTPGRLWIRYRCSRSTEQVANRPLLLTLRGRLSTFKAPNGSQENFRKKT